MKRLSYWIIVGQSRLKPKLKWEEAGKGRWQAKITDGYSYLVVFEPPEKGKVAVWKLNIVSKKKNERTGLVGQSELAMVYSSVAAMAIAELIEAKESDLIPYKSASNMIFVGREQRDLNDFSWDIQKNSAYCQEGLEAYQFLRDEGGKKNSPWDLQIIYPEGYDCDTWELKNIDSLRIGQAIVALMTI